MALYQVAVESEIAAHRVDTNVTVTDSAAVPNVVWYTVNIGIDRAGQAPAIGVSPAATLANYVITGPGPAPVPVSITG